MKKLLLIASTLLLSASAYADDDTIAISVTDITKTDAQVSIVPSNSERNFVWDIITSKMVENAGGIDNIYERDFGWWTYMAEMYDTTWEEAAAISENYGPYEDLASELRGSKLTWDTEYVVYAYYLDENYAQASDVVYTTFKTLPAGVSDITFEVELVNVEPDPSKEGYDKVTLRVTPSNDDSYGNHMHEARFWDFYDGNENFSFQDYLDNQVYPYIFTTRSGVQELTYSQVKDGKEFVFVTLGYDETPTTGQNVNMFRFTADASGLNTAAIASNAIIGDKGCMHVDGDYDTLAVYDMAGRAVGLYRNRTVIELPAGLYIARLQSAAGIMTQKVIVR
ncbi:MAG: T9SS type A sorting domain-containing protein [Muribaculaceae bacterium]|nr:T9SS type A sorting domain-containing protein [Muribaculaceae bacterium]